MAWKRFRVPEFDHRPLRGLDYSPPEVLPAEEAERIAAAMRAGDASVAGAYAVEPDPGLLKSLAFEGEHQTMVMLAAPGPDARLLGRSMAWFNQRALVFEQNAADAEPVLNWRTPRTHNTRLGPEEGVGLESPVSYLLSSRILEDGLRGNRVMIDREWQPGDGRAGVRILAASDKPDATSFHDSYFELTWAA